MLTKKGGEPEFAETETGVLVQVVEMFENFDSLSRKGRCDGWIVWAISSVWVRTV